MKIYELTPEDGRKSFYGKARVLLEDDGTETLISYATPIIRRTAAGELCAAMERLERDDRATRCSILRDRQARVYAP